MNLSLTIETGRIWSVLRLFKFKKSLLGGSYKGNYKTSYLTIPIIAHFEGGKHVNFYGYSGIYFGFLVEAENYSSLTSLQFPNTIVYDLSYDPTEVFNAYELGGIIGMGIKIPLCKKVKFLVDTRYSFGITKAAKNTNYDFDTSHWTEDTPDNFQNVYNHSVLLSLGIIYKLDRKNKNY